jgi:hypothetical protein
MALISDLVSAIAEVEGIPEATVTVLARYAREAGYLSQGARGRNAPRATITDCANLLTIVNGSGCVLKDTAKVIEQFRGLRLHAPHGSRTQTGLGVEFTRIDPDKLRFLDRHGAATFGEVLESIIERFIGGELEMFMNDQASKYLGDKFIEKAAKECGDDPKAVAARVAESCKGLLYLGVIGFRLEFHRPNPFVRLVIDRAVGGDRELIAGASFIVDADVMEKSTGWKFEGDLHEQKNIGYRTLMKIAEVMR